MREKYNKKIQEYEQKYVFINKALLESMAQITEMTKPDHSAATARVKLADKMVMLPLLFDGTQPEVAKQHYERFNQYIKFQMKSGNIRGPVGKAIELFEHTLDKKALVWFQEHKDKFVDLTTLKTMFLQRHNPWGKTKGEQLQSWNILTFDPQKMDIDEHIDLIDTLGDMLGQKDESKKDKFRDTMSTIIQMHLITEKDWAATAKKAKILEHINRKFDPLAAALPTLAKGTAGPGLYSHIAHSNDKDKVEIPKPFKGAHPKQPKPRGGGKSKQPQQKPKNPPPQTQDDQYNYEDTNNYYHIENYRVNPEVIDPIEDKIQDIPLEAKISMAEVKEIRTHTKANIKMMAIKAIITRVIEDSIIIHVEISFKVITTVNLEAEAMAVAEAITAVMVMVGPIIEAMLIINIISIMFMMMSTRQIKMVNHVLYAVAIITLPNIVLKGSMTSMILWKR